MSDVARILKEARDQGRLTALDFAKEIFDDFIELHGDRNFRDDGAVIGGIGRLNGQAVTVVGIQKGKNLQDNLNRNFGQPHPEGYRKALRLMKQAEKFGRPVVTFINTAGAYPGVGAEERGQGEAIARNLMEMSDLKDMVCHLPYRGKCISFPYHIRCYSHNDLVSKLDINGFITVKINF